MPGRRRLTTLLYAFPERTERCSFPTPIHPPLLLFVALFFFPSTATFPPPLLSASSSLYLPLFYPSFPFPYSTRCSALPATRHFLPLLPLLLSRLCSSSSVSSSSRNGGIGKENESHIYIYIYTRFSFLFLFFSSTCYPLPSGRDYRNSTVFHSLFHSLPPSLPSVPLLVFSAPPHNTRAIASYRIAGTSLSILPYI